MSKREEGSFFQYPRPRAFAHRGASAHRPENTLEAFSLALSMGIKYLELDVWTSKDGHVVVFHDETLQRTTNGKGPLRTRTLDELKRLDAGYWFKGNGEEGYPFRGKGITIPTLDEVLKSLPDAMLNIEIKQKSPPMEEPLRDVLVKNGALERVFLASEDHGVISRIRAAFRGEAATGASRRECWEFVKWYATGRRGKLNIEAQALQIPEKFWGIDYLSRGLIKAAQSLGLEVHVWTVNDPKRIEGFLRLGVDGIMSDYPERLLSAAGGSEEVREKAGLRHDAEQRG